MKLEDQDDFVAQDGLIELAYCSLYSNEDSNRLPYFFHKFNIIYDDMRLEFAQQLVEKFPVETSRGFENFNITKEKQIV